MRKLALILATTGFIAGGGAVLAQSTGPHGGLVGGTGGHQTELVVTPTELTVYLLDDGKPHDTEGATLRAVVQQGGKTTTINLVDQQGKRLVGKLDAALAKGAVVVVTGKDGHDDRISARYVIK